MPPVKSSTDSAPLRLLLGDNFSSNIATSFSQALVLVPGADEYARTYQSGSVWSSARKKPVLAGPCRPPVGTAFREQFLSKQEQWCPVV